MSVTRILLLFALSSLLFSRSLAAQQSSAPMPVNDLGPENSLLAQRAGLWDVVETTWSSPSATPIVKKLVAERRMIGSFLEEVLEPAFKAPATDIKRVDYLSFDRLEGRWKYVSMDTRAPVGLMPAASVDRGNEGTINLTFEPFAVPFQTTPLIGQLLLMREVISLKDLNHDRKDQYFNLADGNGKSWLAHSYEYVRSSTH